MKLEIIFPTIELELSWILTSEVKICRFLNGFEVHSKKKKRIINTLQHSTNFLVSTKL